MWKFYQPANVIFGEGELENLGKYMDERHLSRAFMVADAFLVNSGAAAKVEEYAAGKVVGISSEVEPNPTLKNVEDAAKKAAGANADCIIAFGGGSAVGGSGQGTGPNQERSGGSMELVIRALSKQYPHKLAVDRVSLTLTPGIYGLLGANGAGKTTLMRMLCGILHPTGGEISLDGLGVAQEEYRACLGYLPQDFGYYPGFTGEEFLWYMGALKGLPKAQARRRAKELLELVGLSQAAKGKIKTYSGGMKQRLGIAQALLGHPKLLVLDEPTAGLDPKERVRFRGLIASLGKQSIVLVSTHIVSDLAHIADVILLMKDGRIIHLGPASEIADLEGFYLEAFGEEGEHGGTVSL